jgi:hypothetical protein
MPCLSDVSPFCAVYPSSWATSIPHHEFHGFHCYPSPAHYTTLCCRLPFSMNSLPCLRLQHELLKPPLSPLLCSTLSPAMLRLWKPSLPPLQPPWTPPCSIPLCGYHQHQPYIQLQQKPDRTVLSQGSPKPPNCGS